MTITDPTLRELSDYWDRLRAGREAPFRSEIDPRHFESALEHMFILENLGDGNIRIRLAGMSLCEMMGMELRGMSLRALMRVEDRTPLDLLLGRVLADPAVGELTLSAHTPMGETRRAEMLLLPLRSDFGDVSRVLGCLRVQNLRSDDGTPLRFSITASRVEPVANRSATPPAGPLPGFSEEQAPFAGAQPALRSITGGAKTRGRRGETRRNHLRLVDKD